MDISVDAHCWASKVKFKVSENKQGNVVVRVESKHYPSVVLYMTLEQAEELASCFFGFLEKRVLEKELPDPPPCQYTASASDYCANCGKPKLHHTDPRIYL